MRWEWSDWVRYHRWDQFELLAKSDPSQQLCDTVSELAKTIGNRAEEKALKRVLFLLRTAGFEPRDEDSGEPAAPRLPRIEGFSVMFSPDMYGWRLFYVAIPQGSSLHAILMHVMETGVRVKVSQVVKRVPYGTTQDREHIRRLAAPWQLCADLDTAYALHRMRFAYEACVKARLEMDRPLTAFWKRMFRLCPADHPHPACAYPLAMGTQHEERLKFTREFPPLSQWRMFLPDDDALWEEIHAVRWDETLSDVERRANIRQILWPVRHTMCSESTMMLLRYRLMDVAMLLDAPESEDSKMVMQLGESIERNRGDSELIQVMLERLVAHISSGENDEDENDPLTMRALIGADCLA